MIPSSGQARLRPIQHHSRLGYSGPAGGDRPTVAEPGEVLGQLAGRGVAAPRVGVDRLEDHRLQVERDRRVELPRAGRLGLGDLADQLGPVGRRRGRAGGSQLVEGQAQAVDVAPGVAFARGTARGPCSGACRRGRRSGSGRRGSIALARPKSATQTTPVGVEQQVGRLDVAVQDPLRRGRAGGLGHLPADPGDPAPVARPGVLRPGPARPSAGRTGAGGPGRRRGPTASTARTRPAAGRGRSIERSGRRSGRRRRPGPSRRARRACRSRSSRMTRSSPAPGIRGMT